MNKQFTRFIHKKANVEGDVSLGDNVSVWAFASIRGDEGPIVIGKNSNVQENCVIHAQTSIGENVTIGHGAIVHGADIGNNVLIGMHATVMDGVEIGEWSIIAAGVLVSPNTKIPANSVVKGIPGKIVRETTEKDVNLIKMSYNRYLEKITSE